MKSKKGSADEAETQKAEPETRRPEPQVQQPEDASWAIFTDEDKAKAEKQVAERVAASMAIWAASIEVFNTTVHEWTKSRQNAIWKTMKTLSQIQASDSGSKVEQTADVLVEQWTSFQRDFLALQMKTSAKVGTLVEKSTEIVRSTDRDLAARFQENWRQTQPNK